MLMYQAVGEFGTPGFKVIAKELFLQDIGTSTYTEYDPSDPELIKHLMGNPELLEMKKGHIHSHVNMGVFFSATDRDELVENSEFHNYYLSLIVNNKHEMTAMIAFRGSATSTTKTILSFKDSEGQNRTRELVNDEKETCVYLHPCQIYVDEPCSEMFEDRIKAIRKTKAETEAALRAKAMQISKNTLGSHGGHDGEIPKTGWKEIPGWDDIDTGRGRSQGPSAELGWLFEEEENGKGKGKKGGKGKAGTSKKKKDAKLDRRTYAFLTKVVNLNVKHEGELGASLRAVDGTIYGKQARDGNSDLYYEAVESRAIDFYINEFPEDQHLAGYDDIIDDCAALLEEWESFYPELTAGIIQALNFSVK